MLFLSTIFQLYLQFYIGKVGGSLQHEESEHSCDLIRPKEFKKTKLSMSPLKIRCGERKGECFVECLHLSLCRSFAVAKTSNCSSLCLFYNETTLNEDLFLSDKEATYYFLESQTCCRERCYNNGLCDGKSCKCSCTKGYTSTGCVCPSKNTSRQFNRPGKQMLAGDVAQLDIDVHIWAVTKAGKIWVQNLRQTPGSWSEIPGGLIFVTSGPSGVWGINVNHGIFFREGVSDSNPKGNSWTQIPGGLKQIDSGNFGVVYGVSYNNDLFCMPSITKATPSGTHSWIYIPDVKFKYVSCGEFGCWGIKPDNSMLFRTGVTADNCAGIAWLQVDGLFIELDSGVTGSVYAISPEHEVYRRLGVCAENPTGEKWSKILEGRFTDVTVGQENFIALSENGTITVFN